MLPASAGAATLTTVTMLSEKNESVGQAQPHVLGSDGTTFKATGNAGDVILNAHQTSGTDWTLEFAPPSTCRMHSWTFGYDTPGAGIAAPRR